MKTPIKGLLDGGLPIAGYPIVEVFGQVNDLMHKTLRPHRASDRWAGAGLLRAPDPTLLRAPDPTLRNHQKGDCALKTGCALLRRPHRPGGRFPCVRAAASTPVQRLGVVFAQITQPYQPSPKLQSVRPAIDLFEACSAFTRVAARTLAPSPICDQLHRRLQPFRHLHDCSGCFRLERSPGGARPTGKRRLLTAHANSGRSQSARRAVRPPRI